MPEVDQENYAVALTKVAHLMLIGIIKDYAAAFLPLSGLPAASDGGARGHNDGKVACESEVCRSTVWLEASAWPQPRE